MDGRKVESAIQRLLALLYDEPAVLRESCELLAQYRGYAAVAIAYALPEGNVEVVAAAGPGAAIGTHEARIRWDRGSDAEGSIGLAIRSASPVTLTVEDPRFEPWRVAAQSLGIAAVVSLPLRVAESIAGALTAYAPRKRTFDEQEIRLLEGIALDIGRAIEAVRMRLLLAETATRSSAALGRPETLWRLSSDGAADVEQQAETILAEGARTLGFESARVERIEDARIEVEWAVGARPQNVGSSEGGGAALATPIPYGGGAYVLHFSSARPRLPRDAREDRLYAQLLAALIGRLLEQRGTQRERLALVANDPISGLASRAYFMQTLERAVLDPRVRAAGLSVMLIGVDRLGDMRIALGSEEHDRMIHAFADRIRGIVGGHAHVALLAHGEFAVAANGPPERGEQLARVLGEAIALPLVADGREVRCTASIGVALFPNDAAVPEALLEAANAALVRAEHEGGAAVRFFSEEIGNALRLRRAMLQGLRFAVQREEFELHYQPTIDLGERRITHVEALLRWRDPRYGLRLPADFIATAEESEAVLPIDEWVMREAAHRSQVLLCGARRLRLSFNLSGSAVAHAGTLPLLAAVLRDEGVDADTLELELSERIASRDIAASRRLVDGAHDLGMRVALDDFGAGYASLAIVKKLPIDTLKIDGAFVHELPRGTEDAAIVRAAIALGRSLGRHVVAKGVEREETAQWLAAEGCEAAQGYWLSPPLPQEEFLSWLSMHE